MKLIPLFEGQLRFDESTEVGFSTLANSEDGDWVAYVQGDGILMEADISCSSGQSPPPSRREQLQAVRHFRDLSRYREAMISDLVIAWWGEHPAWGCARAMSNVSWQNV